LRQGSGSLAAAGAALGAVLAGAGLSAGPAAVVGETGRWAQAQAAAVGQRLALDGLPAVARDQANRIVFRTAYDRLMAEQKQLTAELARDEKLSSHDAWQVMRLGMPPAPQGVVADLMQVTALLAGMRAISHALGRQGQGQNGLPPVYLLGLDPRGLGHCIVSYGNPDAADNVVTYVPGVGSTLAGANGDLTRASRLWWQANRDAPSGVSVASVYWLGYTAPQLNLSAFDPAQSLATEDEANAAAPALDSFAAGLSAAHVPGFAAHTVMLGHSYGSLVVGRAAVRWPGQLAHDLVFVGSPGVGVDKADQLGVPADHVFAGQAGGDPVPDLPPTVSLSDVEHDPFVFAPVAFGQLLYGIDRNLRGLHDESHFGTNPAIPQFGGQDFSVAHGPYPMYTVRDHSSYWDPRSVSLSNLAHIVDGQYGEIQLAASPAPTGSGR
jgi:alpha/beta hydrolase family protein